MKKRDPKARNVARRVWIELEIPKDVEEARIIAELATRMLKHARRDSNANDDRFWWHEVHQCWCYGGQGGYTELADRGHWFNLDYLGRP